jgi:hypothetical protein
MRAKLLGSAAAGVIVGGILFNAPDARAVLGLGDIVSDPTSYLKIAALQTALTEALQKVQDKLVAKFTDIGSLLDDKLTSGFTQLTNYSKATVGAQQQIADANNTVMATFQKDIRNAELRDEHTLSPQACAALNLGQAITVGAGQAWKVRQALGAVTDSRGEAGPGTPAYAGQGQAAAAITQLHLTRYCSQTEAAVGLCTVDPVRENLDQRSSSLIGVPSYDGQPGVDAANDYATNLIQPIPPAASRGDGLTSVAGQDAQARRRGYNAMMSLSRDVVNDIIASRTNSVTLTADQKAQQANMGLTPTDKSSWYGALELEVYRRAGGVEWAAALQAMTPKSVGIEIATGQAVGNYIALAHLKVDQQIAAMMAANNAATATRDLRQVGSMPSPQMASQ